MKKLTAIFIFTVLITPYAFAEKLPIRITPTETISTHKNEVELGDWIKFKTTNDIYYKNNLFIKKDTPVTGFVDHLHENGFILDNAEITFKKFALRDINGNLLTINYTLKLNRENSVCKGLGDKFMKYIGVTLRGNEIKITPESTEYNIFLEK